MNPGCAHKNELSTRYRVPTIHIYLRQRKNTLSGYVRTHAHTNIRIRHRKNTLSWYERMCATAQLCFPEPEKHRSRCFIERFKFLNNKNVTNSKIPTKPRGIDLRTILRYILSTLLKSKPLRLSTTQSTSAMDSFDCLKSSAMTMQFEETKDRFSMINIESPEVDLLSSVNESKKRSNTNISTQPFKRRIVPLTGHVPSVKDECQTLEAPPVPSLYCTPISPLSLECSEELTPETVAQVSSPAPSHQCSPISYDADNEDEETKIIMRAMAQALMKFPELSPVVRAAAAVKNEQSSPSFQPKERDLFMEAMEEFARYSKK